MQAACWGSAVVSHCPCQCYKLVRVSSLLVLSINGAWRMRDVHNRCMHIIGAQVWPILKLKALAVRPANVGVDSWHLVRQRPHLTVKVRRYSFTKSSCRASCSRRVARAGLCKASLVLGLAATFPLLFFQLLFLVWTAAGLLRCGVAGCREELYWG